MKVLIVCLAMFLVATAKPEFFTFETHYGEQLTAEESVEVDEEAQYLIAKVTPVKGKLTATVNLHDFAVGYTAIKDEDRETCYILEVSHSLQDMMHSFRDSVEKNGYFDVTQKFACTSKKFVPQSEVTKYGDRIAKFCEGNEMVYSQKHFINTKRSKRSTQMMAGVSLLCGICIGWCG